MSTFKVGDTVRYKGLDVEITHIRVDGYARVEWTDAFKEWHSDFDHLDNFGAIPQSPAHAQNPHYARAQRHEAAMDGCVLANDPEGAAVSRDLMQAALWDWYQSEKRGGK